MLTFVAEEAPQLGKQQSHVDSPFDQNICCRKEPASRSRLGESLGGRAVHCLGVMFGLGDEDTDEGTAS